MVKDIHGSITFSKGLTVIDFSATWCGYCKIMAPVLEAISEDAAYQDITFLKCDVDDNQSFIREYGISGLPTLIMFRDGKEIKRQVGALPEAMLRQWLKS